MCQEYVLLLNWTFQNIIGKIPAVTSEWRHSPTWSLGNGLCPSAGVQHRRPRIQEQLMERSLSEKLLEFSVTHLLQGLNIAVVQSIGAPVCTYVY